MTITVIAEGAPNDYVDISGLQSAVASAAGVSVSDVTISVRAASVAITAVVIVPSYTTAAAVSSRLSSSMGTAASASAALGLTVLSEPLIVASNPQSTSSSGFPIAAAAGGGAGGVLVLGLAILLYWYRRKRTLRNVRPQGTRSKSVPTPASSSTEESWLSLSTVSSTSHPPAKTSRAAALLKAWELEPANLIVGDNPADVIGEGGQAVVRRGKWNGVDIAAKMPRNMRHGEAMSQMLRREVRALARVRHPNVVRLYGACLEPVPTVVMALAPSGTLQDALDAHRFKGNSEVVRLLAGIARGMEAVHAHKIIHLDLKPENVLLSADNVPWVTDFGLSTSSNLNSQSTSSAGGRGTIYFKASTPPNPAAPQHPCLGGSTRLLITPSLIASPHRACTHTGTRALRLPSGRLRRGRCLRLRHPRVGGVHARAALPKAAVA